MFWMLQIFVGAIVCVLVWYATSRVRSIAAKALVRAVPVALTLAPGVIIGHGVFFPPGVTLLLYELVSGQRFGATSFVVYSFLALWVIVFVCLLAFDLFDLKYKADRARADERPK
jgi:hypothetical protein